MVALVNIGASVTNVNILSRRDTIFWRDISFGGNQYTDAIQRELNLSFEQAEALKKGENGRPVAPDNPPDPRRGLGRHRAGDPEDVRLLLGDLLEGPVDQLLLSGGCSLTPNLQQVLRERFQVPTELMNPLRRIQFKESDFDGHWLQSIAPMMAVAVGLGIRKAGD